MSKWEDDHIEYVEILGDTPQRMGFLNVREYRERLKWEAKQSRKVMKPFIKWMNEELGLQESTCLIQASLVWRVLSETENDPMLVIGDTTKSSRTRGQVKGAFKKFTSYLLTSTKTPKEDKKWAKDLLLTMASTNTRSEDLGNPDRRPSQAGKDHKVKYRPYTEAEYKTLVDAWKKETASNVAVWAPGMIVLATGADFVEVMNLPREDVIEAEDTGMIRFWSLARQGSRSKSRVIPVRGLKRVFDSLVHYPFAWETITDIVNPTGKTRNGKKATRAGDRVKGSMTRLCKKLEIPWERCQVRVRYYMALKAFLSGDVMVARQYLGYASEAQVIRILSAFEDYTLFEEFFPENT